MGSQVGVDLISEEQLAKETAALNETVTGRPIKDELELGWLKPEKFDQHVEVTSDEKSELPGTMRPRKGAVCYGRGPALRPYRKGVPRDFVDGAVSAFPAGGRLHVADFRMTTSPRDSRRRASLACLDASGSSRRSTGRWTSRSSC